MKLQSRRGTIEHWCPGCNRIHIISVHDLNADGRVVGWDGDRERPSFGETVRLDTPDGICEYRMSAGVQYFTDACWHELRNKSRHLEDLST